MGVGPRLFVVLTAVFSVTLEFQVELVSSDIWQTFSLKQVCMLSQCRVDVF